MPILTYSEYKTAYIECDLADLDDYIYKRKSKFDIDDADDLELFFDKHFDYNYEANIVGSVDYFEILDMYDSITTQNIVLKNIKPKTAIGEEIIIDALNYYFDELL